MSAPLGNKHALKVNKVEKPTLADTRHVPTFYWCPEGHKKFERYASCAQCKVDSMNNVVE